MDPGQTRCPCCLLAPRSRRGNVASLFRMKRLLIAFVFSMLAIFPANPPRAGAQDGADAGNAGNAIPPHSPTPVRVLTVSGAAGAKAISCSKGYDLVIHDECAAAISDAAKIKDVLAPHRAGLPGVNLHCAVHSYRIGDPKQPAEAGSERAQWFDYLGIQLSAHGPKLPIQVTTLKTAHAAIAGLGWREWTTNDEELYNNIQVLKPATALQHGVQMVKGKDGAAQKAEAVVPWMNDCHGARVFATTLGHYNTTVADERYLELVARGLVWACGKNSAEYLNPGPCPKLNAPSETPAPAAKAKKKQK